MTWIAQNSNWTANNRYPGVFRTVQARLAEKLGPQLGGAELKMLSFGCSDGSELSSLRSYFPDALLYGCDISRPALLRASESLMADEAVLFESSATNIQRHGPFDVIFAMSVLCRFPESRNPQRLDRLDEYGFRDFEQAVQTLASSLSDGGILCLYNTNYSFAELAVASGFRALRSSLLPSNGFVDKFSAAGHRLTWCEQDGPFYVHRLRKEAGHERADFIDCIFEQGHPSGQCLVVPVGEPAAIDGNRAPQLCRFGPDLDRCAQQGLIATALGYWFDSADGHGKLVRAWHRTTPEGAVVSGEKWSVRADAASWAALSAPRGTWAAAPVRAPATSAKRTARKLVQRIRATLPLRPAALRPRDR